MNRRHVFQVFRKDGIEILRDRRTLFVNVLLPFLLLPMMTLFGLQIWQVTRLQKEEPSLVLTVGLPARLDAALSAAPGGEPAATGLAATAAEPAARLAERPPAHALPTDDAGAATIEVHAADPELARLLTLDANRLWGARRYGAHAGADAAVLGRLRSAHAAAALVRIEGSDGVARYVLLVDDANRRAPAVDSVVSAALEQERQRLIDEGLERAHEPRALAHPLEDRVVGVAPVAEAVRTRMSNLLPLMLVIFAANGAFIPALDLLAGERERGTLESLLSLPVRRRDIFLGKLLVTCVAAVTTVALNILSIGISILIATHGLAHAAGGSGLDFSSMLSMGALALILCFLALLPLTITLAASALAITGLASSAKEAQNYITPFYLVVILASLVSMVPGTRANFLLDLVPVVGPALALKDCLQGDRMPWLHLGVATAASAAMAWVVVAWATRLLEDERFRYPGLVRAGWGRFRVWGEGPKSPGGLEVIAVYAVALGVFFALSTMLPQSNPVVDLVVPLLAFGVIACAHTWLGKYSPAETLALRPPRMRAVMLVLALLPIAVVACIGLVNAQQWLAQAMGFSGEGPGERMIEEFMARLVAQIGKPLTLISVGVTPAICEELFFRGTMLSGLKRGIGPSGAVVISSFLFAASHGEPDRFFPQFCLGIVLALTVLRTRSIVPGMVLHAGFNSVMIALEFWGEPLWQWLTRHLPALAHGT